MEILAIADIDSTENVLLCAKVPDTKLQQPQSIGWLRCRAAANLYCLRVSARASGSAYARLAVAQHTSGSTRGTLIRPLHAARTSSSQCNASNEAERTHAVLMYSSE